MSAKPPALHGQVHPSAPAAPTGTACKHHHRHDEAFSLAPAPAPAKPPCACKGLMKFRRAHTLLGLWLACFLLCHLLISASGLLPALYQRNISAIHGVPGILPVTLFVILLPMLAQAVLGVFLLGKEGVAYNVSKCNRGGQLRYFAQRMSGVAVLLFAAIHVGTLHPYGLHMVESITHASLLGRYASGGIFAPERAYESTVVGMRSLCGGRAGERKGEELQGGERTGSDRRGSGQQGSGQQGTGLTGSELTGSGLLNTVWMACELLGVWAASFHAANGAWSGGKLFACEKVVGQRRWNFFCCALGIVLALSGTLAWWAFVASPAARLLASLAG